MQSIGLIKASLNNYTVFITGGGSGIGYSTAILFAKMNANVAVNYLNNDKESVQIVNELKKKYPNVSSFPGDVSNEKTATKIIAKVIKKYSNLSFLINNVGIGLVKNPIPFKNFDEINDNFWDKIMKVNLMSAYYCSKAASKYLKTTEGSIINITSISSNGKRGTSIPYAVSKGALETLTSSMAKALAPEVRVNAVSPGFTKTSMTNQRSKQHKQRMADQTLLKRIAEPEEIAEIIFLLCVSGSYITGETINVNGGNGYFY